MICYLFQSLFEGRFLLPSSLSHDHVIRIGTRGSQLARWQSTWVAEQLRILHPDLTFELLEIKTHGDRDRNSPLSAIGGSGLFTKEIQRALLDKTIEIAVHSLKDLPTLSPDGLTLSAVPPREEVADVLIAPAYQKLGLLPPGATIGTGSLRRRAMIMHARPDLRVVGVRGNVETRLNKALTGELDAVILAEAGLNRLGLSRHITDRLEPPTFLPAVGQGALGIECRVDDRTTRELLAPLNHEATFLSVAAERQLLAELEGGCMIPLSAHGKFSDTGSLTLDAAVYDPEGREKITASGVAVGPNFDRLGREVAEILRSKGAERILKTVRDPDRS